MAKKLESTLINMILSLVLISIGMSAALGFVYIKTKDPIEAAAMKKELDAISLVLPPFDSDPVSEMIERNGVVIYPVFQEGQPIGYAVKTYTENGFGGRVELMVGFLPDGSINGLSVLLQKETPGLGTKMTDPSFRDQFLGKNPASFDLHVKKDGGMVDAITAATISSRAYCDALRRGYEVLAQENPSMSGDPVGSYSDASGSIDSVAMKKELNSISQVLPAFDSDPVAEVMDQEGVIIYPVSLQGQLTGYAIKTYTDYGYGGRIELMVGFLPDGSIYGISVLRHRETLGLGSKITKPSFRDQFVGKNPASFNLQVKEDGGMVDAITAATISSRAYCEALLRACDLLKQIDTSASGTSASSYSGIYETYNAEIQTDNAEITE